MSETPQTKHYFTALIIIAILFVLLALFGCKSSQPIDYASRADTTAIRHDTLFVLRHAFDTLRTHDSIYVREVQRGDTILITKFRDRWLYKVEVRHDTLYKAVGDTLRATEVEYKTVTKEVERDYTAWEKVRLRWFTIILTCLIALLAWTFRKQLHQLWTLIRRLF